MEESRKYPVVDLLASAGMALVLLLVGCWALGVSSMAGRISVMYAELEPAELPALSRLLLNPIVHRLQVALVAAAMLGGFAVLFLVRDRVRALVYAIVIVFLVVAGVMMLQFAAMLPLVKVIQSVGS